MVNDIAWADPSDLSSHSKIATLAPELRFAPFIMQHLPAFQDRTALMYAIGELKSRVNNGESRESHVARLNGALHDKLHSEAIEIDRIIKYEKLASNKQYAIAVFNFKKHGKKIEVLFFKDYPGSASFTADDRKELSEKFGIKNDADFDRLDFPGLLNGVWFVNPVAPETPAGKPAPAAPDGANKREPYHPPLGLPRAGADSTIECLGLGRRGDNLSLIELYDIGFHKMRDDIFIIDAKTGGKIPVTSMEEPVLGSATSGKVVISDGEKVIAGFKYGPSLVYGATYISSFIVDRPYRRNAEGLRVARMAGARLMQAAAEIGSRNQISNIAFRLVSYDELEILNFYKEFERFGLKQKTLESRLVEWSLDSADAQNFISGIDSWIADEARSGSTGSIMKRVSDIFFVWLYASVGMAFCYGLAMVGLWGLGSIAGLDSLGAKYLLWFSAAPVLVFWSCAGVAGLVIAPCMAIAVTKAALNAPGPSAPASLAEKFARDLEPGNYYKGMLDHTVAAGKEKGIIRDRKFIVNASRGAWDGSMAPDSRARYLELLSGQLRSALEDGRSGALPRYGYISDIHGQYERWRGAITGMKENDVDICVVLGDSMDRFSDSLKIMEDMIGRAKSQRIVYVLGNHDFFFMGAMEGSAVSVANWVLAENGGSSTLAEMGLPAEVIARLSKLAYRYSIMAQALDKMKRGGSGILADLAARGKISAAAIEQNMADTGEELVAISRKHIIPDKRLGRIYRWLAEHGKVYFIDAYGNPSFHNHIPAWYDGTARLAADTAAIYGVLKIWEGGIRQKHVSDPVNRVMSFGGYQLSDFLNQRKLKDIFSSEEKGKRYLGSIGAARIIHGHTPGEPNDLAKDGQINTDLISGGWLMVGPEGMHYVIGGKVREGGLDSKPFLADTLRLAEKALGNTENPAVSVGISEAAPKGVPEENIPEVYVKTVPVEKPAAPDTEKGIKGDDKSIKGSDAMHTAKAEAKRIHDENMDREYMPAIPKKTILCHIIADPIIPAGQKGMLQQLGQEMKKEDDMYEKIVRLEVRDPDDPNEFMTKLEEARLREEKFYADKGYAVQFDVACHRQGLVAAIQDRYKLKLQALAFTRAEGADAIQVEGIMLALRALRTSDIGKLLAAYKSITGRELMTGETDINELVKGMLFVMPAAIDINRIDMLNRLIKENIWQAA